jgi:hypothetical protein
VLISARFLVIQPEGDKSVQIQDSHLPNDGDSDMVGSITYFVIVSDGDVALLLQNIASFVIGALSSWRAFINKIHCLVASTSPYIRHYT